MKVAIIKYNAGNVQSVIYALNRLGVNPEVTDDLTAIKNADKIIFPGVGEASSAMRSLQKSGIDRIIPDLKQPFLGICLGLQLMCTYSEENDTPCLGIFDLPVKKFAPKLKVPHMGWNRLEELKSPLLMNLPAEPFVYFVHSYYAALGDATIASANYINDFSAALNHNNFYAMQAHPEKSGAVGQKILQNFLDL